MSRKQWLCSWTLKYFYHFVWNFTFWPFRRGTNLCWNVTLLLWMKISSSTLGHVFGTQFVHIHVKALALSLIKTKILLAKAVFPQNNAKYGLKKDYRTLWLVLTRQLVKRYFAWWNNMNRKLKCVYLDVTIPFISWFVMFCLLIIKNNSKTFLQLGFEFIFNLLVGFENFWHIGQKKSGCLTVNGTLEHLCSLKFPDISYLSQILK